MTKQICGWPVWPGWAICLLGCLAAPAASSGDAEEVAVVYNVNVVPDSRSVAEHYAQRRGLPTNRVIGLRLPAGEVMTRPEFRAQLAEPLLQELETRQLITCHATIVPATENRPGSTVRIPVDATIRYLVLCYGVPLKIAEVAKPGAAAGAKAPQPMERTDAAVDTELALLPLLDRQLPIAGVLENTFYRQTNLALLHPTNGLLMVTRLDGPTAAIARGLVDKALEAETNGLWGRAYFDCRGITNNGYKVGDEWIRAACEVARREGFESVLDQRPETFGAGFPMPQIALYAGWYDGSPSGPFKLPTVEFMPGAFAYHLYSFSARTIRAPSSWVGALLAKGATATIGYVNEPFLHLTADIGVLSARLFEQGTTFGEAAYLSLPVLSWQTTVIGDPLYRPRARPIAELEADLARRNSPLLEWVPLRAANLRLADREPPARVAAWLRTLPVTPRSALLQQKLGDLEALAGNPAQAVDALRAALKLKPSPQQRVQLQLGSVQLLANLHRDAEALDAYEAFFRDNPAYPELLATYRQALTVAQKLKQERLVAKYEAQIKYLTPPPPAAGDTPKNGK